MTTPLLTGHAAAMSRIKALVLDSLPSPESRRAYSRALAAPGLSEASQKLRCEAALI